MPVRPQADFGSRPAWPLRLPIARDRFITVHLLRAGSSRSKFGLKRDQVGLRRAHRARSQPPHARSHDHHRYCWHCAARRSASGGRASEPRAPAGSGDYGPASWPATRRACGVDSRYRCCPHPCPGDIASARPTTVHALADGPTGPVAAGMSVATLSDRMTD
jgi:hypothetical protein